MIQRALKLLVLPLTFAYAGSAFAFIDGQLLVGKRWYELSGDSDGHISSQEISVAGHIDPIPLVPVSFGLRLTMGTYNKDQLAGLDVDSATVFEPGIDVMGWLPMVPFVTPYARLTIPVAAKSVIKGESKATGAKSTAEADITGYQIGIGVRYSPIPLFSILAELNRGTEQYKLTKAEIGGEDQGTGTEDLNSNAFLVGVQVGI